MTQEEKELLIKDLSARLPYLVKGIYQWKGNESFDRELTPTVYGELFSSLNSTGDTSFVPYLRPMSSMTDEEKTLMATICLKYVSNVEGAVSELSDFYNSRHFDYRGLIEKGLALEAPEGMYKID